MSDDTSEMRIRPLDELDIDDIVAVELEASRREPYRRLSRLFHVLGRRSG